MKKIVIITAFLILHFQCMKAEKIAFDVSGPEGLNISAFAALVISSLTVTPVVYVNVDAAGANDGTSWTDAFTSIQAGMDDAAAKMAAVGAASAQVWVAEGTYRASVSQGSVLIMKSNVGIYGGFKSGDASIAGRTGSFTATILDGDQNNDAIKNFGDSCHVVEGASNAVLDSFTVQNGYQSVGSPGPTPANDCGISFPGRWNGTGMYVSGVSNLKIFKVLFQKNTGYGGSGTGGGHGIYILDSSVKIGSSFFIKNSGSYGSGMVNTGSSSTIVTNSIFDANGAYDCGANIYNFTTASITVVNTSVNGGSTYLTCSQTLGLSNTGTMNVYNSIVWHDDNINYTTTYSNAGTLIISNSMIKASTPPTGAITSSVSPYTASGINFYLNPAVDTDGAGPGTGNQAINGGSDSYAGNATYGYPAFGINWSGMTTDGTNPDATPVDMGAHY